MTTSESAPLTPEELAGEGVTALPDKEVISILDLAADIDLAIDGAAPIDLAVALNANILAPITAGVSANVLSDGSSAQAMTDQGVQVTQGIDGRRDRDRYPGQHDRPERHREAAPAAPGTAAQPRLVRSRC